ncbi:unnamed protein product, partial [Symbiodinium sp. CCMP2456]
TEGESLLETAPAAVSRVRILPRHGRANEGFAKANLSPTLGRLLDSHGSARGLHARAGHRAKAFGQLLVQDPRAYPELPRERRGVQCRMDGYGSDGRSKAAKVPSSTCTRLLDAHAGAKSCPEQLAEGLAFLRPYAAGSASPCKGLPCLGVYLRRVHLGGDPTCKCHGCEAHAFRFAGRPYKQ